MGKDQIHRELGQMSMELQGMLGCNSPLSGALQTPLISGSTFNDHLMGSLLPRRKDQDSESSTSLEILGTSAVVSHSAQDTHRDLCSQQLRNRSFHILVGAGLKDYTTEEMAVGPSVQQNTHFTVQERLLTLPSCATDK